MKKHHLISAIMILFLASPILASPAQKADPSSGVQALEMICQAFSVKTSSRDTKALEDKTGVDALQGFIAVLEKKKLHAVEEKIGLDEVMASELPALAMLWDERFVVIGRDGSGNLAITDPSKEQKVMSVEEFKNAYSGLAVMISRDKISLSKPQAASPDLRFDWYLSDFGAVNCGDKIERTLKFRNVGTADLNIAYARATCGCAVTALSGNTIAPNGEGEIKILLDTKGRQGMQEHKIYVTSNDPVTPIAQIQLTGRVISEKVTLYPRNIDFGILRKNESICREVNVYDSGGYDFQVTKAVSDSPYVNCAIITVGDDNSPRYLVQLTLAPDVPIGDLKVKVTITTTHPKDPVVEVPVTAVVKENVGSPYIPVIFGSVKKGRTAEQSILIFSSRTKPFRISKIDNPFQHMRVRAKSDKDGKECRVTLILDKDAPAETFIDEVVLHTYDPDQPVVKLGVSGRVAE